MNHSVSAFALKGKTYSKTESLETRVTIAACIQIVGYEAFWELIYSEFGVTFDGNLRKYLRNMDKKKKRKGELAQTKEGKSKRSHKRKQKLTEEHNKDMAAQREEVTYESGVVFKTAQRAVKQKHSHKERNPEGVPKKEWKCNYWHVNNCQVRGHASLSSKQCKMYGKSAADREEAMNKIIKDLIEEVGEIEIPEGKY